MTSPSHGPSAQWVVIFTSIRTPGDKGYGATADRLEEILSGFPGFCGMQSARNDDGSGITVCYWESEEAIAAWRAHTEHAAARASAPEWYREYEVVIAPISRRYGGPA